MHSLSPAAHCIKCKDGNVMRVLIPLMFSLFFILFRLPLRETTRSLNFGLSRLLIQGWKHTTTFFSYSSHNPEPFGAPLINRARIRAVLRLENLPLSAIYPHQRQIPHGFGLYLYYVFSFSLSLPHPTDESIIVDTIDDAYYNIGLSSEQQVRNGVRKGCTVGGGISPD